MIFAVYNHCLKQNYAQGEHLFVFESSSVLLLEPNTQYPEFGTNVFVSLTQLNVCSTLLMKNSCSSSADINATPLLAVPDFGQAYHVKGRCNLCL